MLSSKSEPIPFKRKELFPKLMFSEDLIVFFYQFGIGIVVNGDDHYTIGSYSDDWAMDNFKDFYGKIELIQE